MLKLLAFLAALYITGDCAAQSLISATEINPTKEYDNVYVERIAGDSLVSTFIIWIKENVPMHKHQYHSENVIVIEGTAIMTLGDKQQEIKAGDIIFIPANTWHDVRVTSETPLKVVSVKSPYDDGKDVIIYKKQ
jgi:mannose-6-phosphate isomerase-like protein (cupin superfamily)